MLVKEIRFILVTLLFIFGCYLLMTEGLLYALVAFGAAMMMLLGHFWYGPVWLASQKMQKGEFDKARKLLEGVKKPEWLLSYYKSDYYLLKGVLALYDKNLDKGEHDLKYALNIGLKSESSQALALLNLAHICLLQKRGEECRAYLEQGKKLKANLHVLKEMEVIEEKLRTTR